MKLPLEITFRNVRRTEALDERIRVKAAKLDQFSDRIMGCRVVVESPHRHQLKGNVYQVHIALTVPGQEIAVSRRSREAHEDLMVCVRDAFNAAQRQLLAYEHKRNASTSHTNLRIAEALSASV